MVDKLTTGGKENGVQKFLGGRGSSRFDDAEDEGRERSGLAPCYCLSDAPFLKKTFQSQLLHLPFLHIHFRATDGCSDFDQHLNHVPHQYHSHLLAKNEVNLVHYFP